MACERAKTARVDVILAASELTESRQDGLSLLDALAIELGQLPPVLLLVRDTAAGPAPGGVDRPRRRRRARLAPEGARDAGASRGAESAPPSAIYSGSLAKVSLSDVVETLWVDRKGGTIAITTPFGAGDVRLVDGAIVDAVYLRFEGMKALVRMIGEPEGRFLFTPDTPAVLGRMKVATSELLRDVARHLAETKRLRALLGDLAAKVLLAGDGGDHGDLSPLARAVLAKLRGPATVEEVLDELPEPDALILAAIVDLDSKGRVKRLALETQRVPLVGTDQLHLMRALVSRACAQGYEGPARFIFAGTPSRLAVFAHAALCLSDALASPDAPPTIPIPHSIATVRLGDDVDLELVALPLVPAYAPLWPLSLAGSAIVVRLDDAAGSSLTEACAAAELPVLDAQVLVGELEEGSVAQVASLVRAALEATQDVSSTRARRRPQLLRVDDRPDRLAGDDSLDVPPRHQFEDADAQRVVAAKGHGRRVHDADAVGEEAIERHLREHLRVGEAHRVAVVDAVDLRRLEEGVGVDLHRAQRRCGVGREVRIARPPGEDHHPPLLEVPHRPPPDVRLGDLPDLDRGLHPRRDVRLLERVLEREAVDDRREHPHVVALRAVHPLARPFEPAEDVAAADDDPALHAERVHVGELGGEAAEDVGGDAEAAGGPAEGLAAQLEDDPLVPEVRVERRGGDGAIVALFIGPHGHAMYPGVPVGAMCSKAAVTRWC